MLYSIAWEEKRATELRVFYADTDEEALDILRVFAERRNVRSEDVRLQLHPKGLWVGSRFHPAAHKGEGQ